MRNAMPSQNPLGELVQYLFGDRRDASLSRLNMSYDELMPNEQAMLDRVGKRAGYQSGDHFLRHLQGSKAQQRQH
jgi:hypothetical protein